MTQVIKDGAVMGETVDQMTRKISELVNTRGKREVEAVVRTAVNHIGTEARSATYEANADILAGKSTRQRSTAERLSTVPVWTGKSTHWAKAQRPHYITTADLCALRLLKTSTSSQASRAKEHQWTGLLTPAQRITAG